MSRWWIRRRVATAEFWYLRTDAGAACGPGDQESLSETIGAAEATKVLDGTGDTWNRTETGRTILAGNWRVDFWVDVSDGGGPPNEITVIVEKRNSACGVLQTLLSDVVSVDKGVTEQKYSTATVTLGSIGFAVDDILTVRLAQTRGNRTITLHYNGGAADNAASVLIQPPQPAGAVTYYQTNTGELTSSGTLIKKTSKALAGTITDSGALVKSISHQLLGTLTLAGAIAQKIIFSQGISGVLTFSSNLIRKIQKVLTGTLTKSGILTKKTSITVIGALSFIGASITKFIKAQAVAGVLTLSGIVAGVYKAGAAVAGVLFHPWHPNRPSKPPHKRNWRKWVRR